MAQHIRKNIPFTGNIAYQTREYAYNNDVTQLVRHTIEYIRLHPYANGILQNDADTKEAVNAIAQATPTYNRQERLKVINRNLRPIRHPYYGEYRYLQKLCLQILRHEELKYGTANDEIYGILFDGAWLWEEYLNTLLAPIGFLHPRNKDSQGAIWLFNNPKSAPRYPDFYRQDFILDAKYKGYTDKRVSEVDRDDLHQLITYMYIKQAAHGGLVYPSISSDTAISPAKLCGYGGTISLYGMTIPQSVSSWSDFQSSMLHNEETLIKHIVE
jgi:5-methylcytosine-specific restriction endonuclease McrBC regulatory subunit McrC